MSKTYRSKQRRESEQENDAPSFVRRDRQYPCVVCTALYPRYELEVMPQYQLAGLFCAACAQNIQNIEDEKHEEKEWLL